MDRENLIDVDPKEVLVSAGRRGSCRVRERGRLHQALYRINVGFSFIDTQSAPDSLESFSKKW